MAERRDSTDLLSAMNLPVLIIAGSEDRLTPVAEAEAMRTKIPGARLRVIQSAGHLSNLENPDEFNAALGGFIDEVKRNEGATT